MSVLHVSTNRVAEEKRSRAIQDLYASVANIRVEQINDAPLYILSSLTQLPQVSIARTVCGPCFASRNNEQLADGNDDVVLCLVTDGAAIIELQSGRQVRLGSGDAYLGPNNVSSRRIYTERTSFLDISLPRIFVAPFIADADRALMQRDLDAGASPELAMLAHYVQMITARNDLLTPATAQLAATHIQDLIIVALGAKRDIAAKAENRSLRSVRLSTIKTDILARITEPQLSLQAIAHNHKLSVQYVRKLFRDEGTTFTDFVRMERLKRALHILHDSRFAHLGISTIAFECGFNDLSYFNRLFRRCFGRTPSEVRASDPQTAVRQTSNVPGPSHTPPSSDQTSL